jgi:macrolide-specific efflux system membrane fusion protein
MVPVLPPRNRQYWIKWAFLLIPVVGLLLWWRPWAASDSAEQSVRTVTVVTGDIEDVVSALGTLEPLQYVDVGTQVSGQLQKIYVDFGDTVKAGDLLAQIDPTVYQARVNGDQAQLNSLRAQIADKEAQRVLADQQLKRQQTLLNSRATSQDAYDSAVATLKSVQAQIDALTAQTRQTESVLNGDQANLGYTKIYAPMAGTVVDINARQGQTLNAVQQAPTILRVADLSTMKVNAQVSEADVTKLKVGMVAYFSTLGRSDRRLFGKLRQVLPTPTVTNNVVLYNVLFDVANLDGELLPQMSAQVFFVVASAHDVPVVPMEALIAVEEAGKPKLYRAVVLKDGKSETRDVTLGVSNRVLAEIKSGLQLGDVLVVGQPGSKAPATGASAPARTPRL